jgi:hypothetical protein
MQARIEQQAVESSMPLGHQTGDDGLGEHHNPTISASHSQAPGAPGEPPGGNKPDHTDNPSDLKPQGRKRGRPPSEEVTKAVELLKQNTPRYRIGRMVYGPNTAEIERRSAKLLRAALMRIARQRKSAKRSSTES